MPSASAQTFPNIILTGSTDERIRVWDLDTTSEAEAEGEEDNRAGDLTRASKNKKEQGPRLIGELEGHWHEVGALAAWRRTRNGPLPEGEGDGGDEKGEWKVGEAADAAPGKSQMAEEGRGEWWIVSASLDGSIRRWKLAGKFFCVLGFVSCVQNVSNAIQRSLPPLTVSSLDALRPRPVLPSNTASIASQPASHAPSTNGTTASCRTSNGKDASSTQSTSKPKMDANANTMTEEEERELAELMGDDDEDEDMED